MPKKQQRIFQKKIQENLDLLTNRECNIVFQSGKVLHGKIVSLKNNQLHIRDSGNKKHIHTIPELREIVVDYPAEN